ncbi:glutamate 5-kinase [Salinisphaera orenii MK-B5]|uniref:Glutamate 5-kinase n=1 Tax=Salinisphaera orenii MK-B5 TaxID=856730 RepID=A0A423PXM2_9GAMM|nr:glutamate 5-kinase [Salinisphaera orenii]ROO30356.1 glutamate 5-kinase [Salinisphaera orenii MK-B5]
MITTREQLKTARRWVVKIGSALLTADGRGLDTQRLENWAGQIAALHAAGAQVVLVSSGAVAEGLVRLGWPGRPTALNELQAAASVGQAGLVEAYNRCFKTHGLQTAQVLLTHDDVSNRGRYLNARGTLLTLLEMDVIPIVNENDAVVTDEIRVGDNDTVAALAVNLLDADGLIILTDQAGVYDADPRTHPDATLIDIREATDAALLAAAGERGGALGRGGMRTKVIAARQAADSGATTVIADGLLPDVLARVVGGEPVGTMLIPDRNARRAARKNWIAGQRRVRGRVHLDAGAVRVLRDAGRSLLPIGITAVEGDFRRGDLVACLSDAGEEIAQGLANYDAREARLLAGQSSERIAELIGYAGEPEFIHRNNLVVSRTLA